MSHFYGAIGSLVTIVLGILSLIKGFNDSDRYHAHEVLYPGHYNPYTGYEAYMLIGIALIIIGLYFFVAAMQED